MRYFDRHGSDQRLSVMGVWLVVVLVAPVFDRPALGTECEPAVVTEVAPGVFVRPGQMGRLYEQDQLANIGFIVGQECVAVIDSGGSPAEGEALACAISAKTDRPVCYVVLTHHHPDHTLGSAAFVGLGARFIGHERLAEALRLSFGYFVAQFVQHGRHLDEQALVLPDQMLAADATVKLDLGARVLIVQAHPNSHSGSDLTVFDQHTQSLWLADLLFVDHVPALDGSASGWLAVSETLRAMPAEQAIPGHGPVTVAWPAAISEQTRYLKLIRREAKTILDAGGFLEEAVEQVGQSERGRWSMFDDFHRRNVSKTFAELEWE